MNKKMYLGAVALSLLTGPLAFADETARGPTVWDGFSGLLTPDWERDFSVTLGTKVWLNEWARERGFISEGALGDFGGSVVPVLITDTAPDAQESDIEPVPIPQLSVRYQWLIVTGGYYSKTEFEFEPTIINTLVTDRTAIRQTRLETSGERYEWDASGGIYVHPYVAILGGYKKVRQTIDVHRLVLKELHKRAPSRV